MFITLKDGSQFADNILNVCFLWVFFKQNVCIFITTSPQTGDEALPESVMTQFAYAHYNDVILGAMASQITSLTIVYSTAYSGADQRKHQISASLAFVSPLNSPHKWSVTRKMFPFDDVIMIFSAANLALSSVKICKFPLKHF